MISKKERTREAILSVTYELFAREGFNKITMKDICEATGMSRGGLYSHFGSTREVFEAILEKINQKDEMNFQKEMEAGVSAVDILDRALMQMRDEIVNVILYAYQGIRMWSRIIKMSPVVFDSITNHIRKQLVKE